MVRWIKTGRVSHTIQISAGSSQTDWECFYEWPVLKPELLQC